MARTGADISLEGVSSRINGRHAFVHERVLELIVRETEQNGSVNFRKSELVERLGCCERTIDRSLTRLRREGLVTSTPVFNDNGAQLGNTYSATEAGKVHARCFTTEKASRRAKSANV